MCTVENLHKGQKVRSVKSKSIRIDGVTVSGSVSGGITEDIQDPVGELPKPSNFPIPVGFVFWLSDDCNADTDVSHTPRMTKLNVGK